MSLGGGTETRALAAGALAVWALCFGVRIKSALSGTPLPPFFVSADPGGGPPTLLDFRAGGGAEGSLEVGDRLLQLGNQELAGVGPLELFVAVARAGRAGDAVVAHFERGDTPGSVRIELPAAPFEWFVLPTSLAWASLAALILLRSSWARVSRYAFWATLGVALTGALFGGSRPVVLLSLVALSTGTGLMAVFGVLFCWSFPVDERAAPTARDRGEGAGAFGVRPPRWPWLFGAAAVFQASRDFGVGLPPTLGRVGLVATLAVAVVAGVGLLVLKLPAAQPPARQELLWALSGVVVSGAFIVVGLALLIADRQFLEFYRFAVGAAGVVPAAWAIAIFRYRSFDVHRLLSAATTYTIAAVVLLAAGLFVYARLVGGALTIIGGASIAVELLLAAAFIALAVPAYRRLRPLAERLFLRERIRFREGVGHLMEELSRCHDIEEIWMRTGERLDELIAPYACAIYVSAGAHFAPIFHRGAAMPTEIRSDHPLIGMLRTHHDSVDLQHWGWDGLPVPISAEDRLLDTVHAAVVVPVTRRDQLSYFIVLGEKRSGDVYTTDDRMLFDALARVISAELERLDDSTLAAIGEGMVHMMRDLSEPLGVMSRSAALMARARTPEEKAELVAVILGQFRLMQRMVGDVLAFARGEASLLVRTVNVGVYLEELRGHLAPVLEGTSVSLVITPGYTGDGLFDAARLTRAITTIARYAVEAAPGRRTLRVETSADRGRVVFALSYDGSGALERMLQGSGALGMATVKRTVNEHSGDITVESNEIGTSIRIALPLPASGELRVQHA